MGRSPGLTLPLKVAEPFTVSVCEAPIVEGDVDSNSSDSPFSVTPLVSTAVATRDCWLFSPTTTGLPVTPAALQALNTRVQAYATDDHVDATPTFVINGAPLEAGYHSLAELDAAIAKTAKREAAC